MNVIVSAAPKRLAVTQAMVEDFLCDPVMGAKVILGYDLDAFQKARLRYYWWVPNGVDSSGYSSGKTIVDWIYIALRCLLIPGHHAGVYYPTFETGKLSFWTYYRACQSPIFRAQMGRTDENGESEGKTKSEGAACFKAFYRNGSQTLMPAPSFVKDAHTQASLRLNTLLVEEWTHVDAMGDGINKQLLGRVSRPSWNQHHPIWANHIHFTAPAKESNHPGYPRYQGISRKVRTGNPSFFAITYSHRDFSDLKCHTGKTFREEYRVESQIAQMKTSLPDSEWLAEGLGVWSESGQVFYTEGALGACVDAGVSRGVLPLVGRRQHKDDSPENYYFMGADPAPAQGEKSDSGGLVIIRAKRREGWEAYRKDSPEAWYVDAVYARRVRNVSVRQWSGLMHSLNRRFSLVKIAMDPGGGGQWIKKELAETKQLIDGQEIEVTPIVSPDDVTVADGNFSLMMVQRGDSGIESIWPGMQGDDVMVDRQHTVMQEALTHAWIGFPRRHGEVPRDEMIGWGEELVWASKGLAETLNQFLAIGVKTKADGTLDLTKNVARRFSARGKKDFVSATLNAYTAFLVWLKNGEGEDEEEDVQFMG